MPGRCEVIEIALSVPGTRSARGLGTTHTTSASARNAVPPPAARATSTSSVREESTPGTEPKAYPSQVALAPVRVTHPPEVPREDPVGGCASVQVRTADGLPGTCQKECRSTNAVVATLSGG